MSFRVPFRVNASQVMMTFRLRCGNLNIFKDLRDCHVHYRDPARFARDFDSPQWQIMGLLRSFHSLAKTLQHSFTRPALPEVMTPSMNHRGVIMPGMMPNP